MRLFPDTPGSRADDDAMRSPRYNPPKQASLGYRAGTYQTFLRGMLDRIQTEPVTLGDGSLEMPLRNLNVTEEYNFAVALLRSWAVVGDVLTFYQERIANEGFIRTATEDRSLIELVRTIGYTPRHGLAAGAYLSFTVVDAPGAPGSSVVPAGTAIQSVPGQGERPQIFETTQAIEARAEWNAMSPRTVTLVEGASLRPETNELRLAGLKTGLRPGDVILIIGDGPASGGYQRLRRARTVVKVEQMARRGHTIITLDPEEKGEAMTNLEVHAFGTRANLFGYNARTWESLPDAIKERYSAVEGGVHHSGDRGDTWRSINAGLPNKPILSVAVAENGTIYAGTAGGGVFRSGDGGATWKAINNGLTKLDIHALAINARGQLFAGTSGGSIFRSTDDGAGWEPMRGTGLMLRKGWGMHAVNRKMPNTIVHALASSLHEATYFFSMVTSYDAYLFAGTDDGIFRSEDNGDGWTPINKGLLNTNPESGATSTIVHAIVMIAHHGHLFIGTDTGIYRSTNRGGSWSPINTGIPGTDPHSGFSTTVVRFLLSYPDPKKPSRLHLVAGTDLGLFRSDNGGDRWEGIDGLGVAAVRALAGAVDPDTGNPHLFVAVDDGLYRSDDEGRSWKKLAGGPEGGVGALAANGRGDLVAATGSSKFVEKEWPNFHPAADAIDLDSRQQRLIGGGWAVLQERRSDAPPRMGVVKVGAVSTVTRNDYEINGTVSRLEVESGDGVETFDLRDTVVHLKSERLDLFEPVMTVTAPVRGDSIELDHLDVGLEPGRRLIVSGKRARVALGELGGVLRVGASGTARIGLANLDVRTMAMAPDGTLFAGTDGDGLFRSSDGGANWAPADILFSVDAAAGDDLDKGVLPSAMADGFAGAGIGLASPVVLAEQHTERWTVSDASTAARYPVARLGDHLVVRWAHRDLRAVAFGVGHTVYAATHDGGAFRSDDNGDTWSAINDGLSDRALRALAVLPDGSLIAAATGGLFRMSDGKNWTPIGGNLLRPGIGALALGADGALYAGSATDGVYRSADGGTNWMAINEGLANRAVHALQFDPDGVLYPGTDAGVYRSSDRGASWESAAAGIGDLRIRALAAGPHGEVIGGSDGAGIVRSVDRGTLWEQVAIGPSSDVRALLFDASGNLLAGVRNVATLRSADGRRLLEIGPSLLFRLDSGYAFDLDGGDLTADLRGEFKRQGIVLDKDAVIDDAPGGGGWSILQKDLAYVIRPGIDGLAVYDAPRRLLLLGAPLKSAGGEMLRWHLLDRGGFDGYLDAPDNALALMPAAEDDPTISELAEVAGADNSADHTVLMLRAPLAMIYDRPSFTILGNIAHATHGKSVANEVLGSGNAAAGNQQFQLKRSPLTYLSAATADGSESTLSIRIKERNAPDGILWHEVPSLLGRDARERCFVVRTDEAGKTSVLFGDGHDGARLPTGAENVIAAYRTGLGPEGNVDAESILLMQKRPLGVRSVINPLPASGGTAAETMADARRHAPRTVRTLDRIVSLDDYGDFAATFAGVAKAQARSLWNGRRHLLHLSIAPADGSVLDRSSDILADLSDAIGRYRAPSSGPVLIDSYLPVWFNIEASIWIEPGWVAVDVIDNVTGALDAAFAFERRSFDQDVSDAEVTNIIQRSPGVLAVRLDALYRRDHSRSLQTLLAAGRARWDERLGEVVPDGILRLDMRDGVIIRVVGA